MATRREINSKHESAVLDAAIDAHNKLTKTKFSVESRPDPPDAILIDGSHRTWIEHTDVFYPGWAEDLTSFAATDKEHKPMQKGLHMDMDNIVANTFVDVVFKKINKASYKPLVEEFGAGILVVGIESPWFDNETIQAINNKWNEAGTNELSTIFKWVYLGYRTNGENRAMLWKNT